MTNQIQQNHEEIKTSGEACCMERTQQFSKLLIYGSVVALVMIGFYMGLITA